MAEKRASSKQRERKRGAGRDPVVILHVPEGTEIPTGPRRVGSAKRKRVGKRSGGWTLERASGPFWDELRRKRESSDPHSEFSRTWDDYQTRKNRIRDARKNFAKVGLATAVTKLVEDALIAGMFYERLLWKFGGIGDLVLLSLEAGIAKLKGIEGANEAKETPIAELEHKVVLIRMDEPDTKRPAIAEYLLGESDTDSRRCHECQRHERAVARKTKPPCQVCERYRRYEKCKPCAVCLSWHMRLSEWVQERSDKRRNREAIVKRILRIDQPEADDRTTT